jgi:filamentous hemagglutinin family protein
MDSRQRSRDARREPSAWLMGCLALVAFAASAPHSSLAQSKTVIKTDGSWGRAARNLMPPPSGMVSGNRALVGGSTYTIPESMGKVSGTNLFHSFERFDVGAGDAAVFTTQTKSLTNVISRVSGLSSTSIDGLLALRPAAGSSPNFFLINPNGITLGAQAVVDVPAAFHLSTATSLTFKNGTTFRAASGADSTLSIAAPATFGFIGAEKGIALERAFIGPVAQFDLTATNIRVTDSDVRVFPISASGTSSPSLRLAATGMQPVFVPVEGSTASVATIPPFSGRIDIVNSSLFAGLQSDSASAAMLPSLGAITIEGGTVHLDDTIVSASINRVNSNNRIKQAGIHLLGRDEVELQRTWLSGATESELADASDIEIKAPRTRISDSVIAAQTLSPRGDAGNITLSADVLTINGSRISSSTQSPQGDAGSIVLTAESITMSSSIIDAVAFEGSSGGTGNIKMQTGHLTLDQSLISLENFAVVPDPATRRPGKLLMDTSEIAMTQSTITAEVRGTGLANQIQIQSSSGLTLTGDGNSLITASASGFGGAIEQAGDILIRSPNMRLDGLTIQTDTASSAGAAGGVNIEARTLSMSNTKISASIRSRAPSPSAFQRPGEVRILAIDSLSIDSSSILSTNDASSAGDAGRVFIASGGSVDLSNSRVITATDSHFGRAGEIELTAPRIGLKATFLSAGAGPSSSGQVGDVKVVAKEQVTIATSFLSIENDAQFAPFGAQSGSIFVGLPPDVHDSVPNVVITGTTVAAGTNGHVDAGSVNIHAATLTIDNGLLTTTAISTGAAGSISLIAENALALLNSKVATDTAGAGAAGNITLSARTVFIDPTEISSRAVAGSSGQAGNVAVTAREAITIVDGSKLSIENNARVAAPSSLNATTLSVNAPRIDLLGGRLSAASSDNVPASSVQLAARDQLLIRDATILTTAQDGNGGKISVNGGRGMVLDHSQIMTSVFGTQNGNAGDIGVTAQVLVMDSGVIQANTRVAHARGGNISIDVQAFVTSGELIVGGGAPATILPGVNVIQAAAPDGVAGNINVSEPVLDIAASLHSLSTKMITTGALTRDWCRLGASSSLTPLGRGGLRPTASGLIRPDRGSDVATSREAPHQTALPATASASRLEPYRCEY